MIGCFDGSPCTILYFKKGSADLVSTEECMSSTVPQLPQQVPADDIYNNNETGVFHCTILHDSLSYKHATLSALRKDWIV